MGGQMAKFYSALQKGNEKQALLLYESAGVGKEQLYDPNHFYGKCSHRNTPLHYAAKHAMPTILHHFLNNQHIKGDPSLANADKQNCLHLVCRMSPNRDAMSSVPGSVNDDKGGTGQPSITAVEEERRVRAQCVELLLKWRSPHPTSPLPIDIQAQDMNGNTALHIAVMSNLLDCVKLLRKAGASLSLENNQRKTALDVCNDATQSKSNVSPEMESISQYLESSLVFDYHQDNQEASVAEIEALTDSLNEYEFGPTRSQSCDSAGQSDDLLASLRGGGALAVSYSCDELLVLRKALIDDVRIKLQSTLREVEVRLLNGEDILALSDQLEASNANTSSLNQSEINASAIDQSEISVTVINQSAAFAEGRGVSFEIGDCVDEISSTFVCQICFSQISQQQLFTPEITCSHSS